MNKRAKSNTIRVIAGQWRGRKVPVLDHPGLRPTTDRVRETLFNWLMHDVPSARCLDLFAGTGILGLEALSRGARFVDFVERESQVAKALASNLHKLECSQDRWRLTQGAAEVFLRSPPKQPFDLVFLDPPFAADLLPQTLVSICQPGWLAEDALIYIEQSSEQDMVALPQGWLVHREGRAGQSRYRLCSLIER